MRANSTCCTTQLPLTKVLPFLTAELLGSIVRVAVAGVVGVVEEAYQEGTSLVGSQEETLACLNKQSEKIHHTTT